MQKGIGRKADIGVGLIKSLPPSTPR